MSQVTIGVESSGSVLEVVAESTRGGTKCPFCSRLPKAPVAKDRALLGSWPHQEGYIGGCVDGHWHLRDGQPVLVLS
jgi:hypothetical protein